MWMDSASRAWRWGSRCMKEAYHVNQPYVYGDWGGAARVVVLLRGEVVAGELADVADRVLETVARSEVVGGEDTDHDAFAGPFEDADVVTDVRQEIAGFVRDAVPRDVARQARRVDLAAQDLEHLRAGFFADRLAALELFQEHAHIARRTEPEGRFGFAVEGLGARGGAEGFEPCVGFAGRMDGIEAPLLHESVDRVATADLVVQKVRGGVIADDDHQGEQVLDGELDAGIEAADDAGARLFGGVGELDAVGELEFAGGDLAVYLGHQRDLDHGHGVHLPIGADRDLLAGFEAADVDTPRGVHGLGDTFDIGLEARERRRLRLRESGAGGEEDRQDEAHSSILRR